MDFKSFLKSQVLEFNRVAYLPLNEQAKLADQICRYKAEKSDYNLQVVNEIKGDLVNINKRNYYMNFNTTSLGNIAYIIIKSNDKESNEYLLNILREFREFWQNDGSKNIDEVVEAQYQKYSNIKLTIPSPQIIKLGV